MDDTERRQRVDDLNRQAESLRWIDYDRVRELAEQAFELACQSDGTGLQYPLGMATALWLLADHHCTMGDWAAALSETSQGLALLDSEPGDPAVGWLLVTSGKSRYFLGDYVESLGELTSALRVAQESGDKRLEAYVLDRIASVHSATGHLDVSLETHERALSLNHEVGYPLGEALALNNMAYGYLYLGSFDSALRSAERSLALAEELGSIYLRLGVLDTLADIYLHMGRYDDAERYSREELELAESRGLELDVADALLALARVEAARENLADAIANAERAQGIDARRGRVWEEYQVQLLLSELHERSGNPDRALQHFRRYHELESRTRSRDAENTLARLRIEHQVESARQSAEILRLRSLALAREVEQANLTLASVEAQASLDPLTGLFNRRHLAVLADELRHAVDEGVPCALAMFDVDHFKDINDTYGHSFGDQVLVAIAGHVRRSARKGDMPCRWGGDEFLLLLTDMDIEQAHLIAERIRSAVATDKLGHGGNALPITVSAGVADVDITEVAELESLIAAADRALYAAKKAGRNRIAFA
jgi:diguanylate cyclase (GGDEF)-like protein